MQLAYITYIQGDDVNKSSVKFEAVAISDVHLGTRNCNLAKLNSFFNELNTEKLVLCGDIVDFSHGDFKKYPIQHYIDRLRELSKTVEVVWVCGNHEVHYSRVLQLAKGSQIQVEPERHIDYRLHTLFVHGHLYSGYSSGSWKNLVLKSLYDFITPLSQRLHKLSGISLVHYLKSTDRAREYIESYQGSLLSELSNTRKSVYVNTICCGHIHCPTAITSFGRLYVCCGDFIDHCTYAAYSRESATWEIYRV